jgi:hypothetical protein
MKTKTITTAQFREVERRMVALHGDGAAEAVLLCLEAARELAEEYARRGHECRGENCRGCRCRREVEGVRYAADLLAAALGGEVMYCWDEHERSLARLVRQARQLAVNERKV